jgi:hypothetical protein
LPELGVAIRAGSRLRRSQRLIAEILTKVSAFLKRIKATAEQLTQGERWKLILSAAFRQFLGGKIIGRTGRLADATG